MDNGNLPAAPVPWGGKDEVEPPFTEFMQQVRGGSNYGLTKREAFAMAALQGILSSPATDDAAILAKGALTAADALLAALEDG